MSESRRAGRNDLQTLVENYKRYKSYKTGNPEVTYKELRDLKEAYNEANRRGIRLREADPNAMPPAPQDGGFNGEMGQDMTGAPQPQDPMVLQGAIDQALAALEPFSSNGQNDLGGDPDAGIPPVDGMQMDGQQGALVEAITQYASWKRRTRRGNSVSLKEARDLANALGISTKKRSSYSRIKERIRQRDRKIRQLNENGAQDYAANQLKAMGLNSSLSSGFKGSTESGGGDKTPTAQQLASGYSSGPVAKPGKRWPTKAMGKEAGGSLQGAGATNKKVREGVQSVTDVYVDRFLSEDKLSFNKIKESLKNGLLG